MPNQRETGARTLAVVAALVAVIGLGLGFAAFTRTLTISSSATVTPEASDFNIHFITPGDGTINLCTTSSAEVTASPGTVETLTVTGATASLKAPGDYAICTYKVQAENNFTAYLRSVAFASALTCTAGTGTTQSLVDAACTHIKATVQVGGDSFSATGSGTGIVQVTNTSAAAGANNAVSGFSISRAGQKFVFLKIYYDNDTNAATELADGQFTVDVKQISLGFSTADAS